MVRETMSAQVHVVYAAVDDWGLGFAFLTTAGLRTRSWWGTPKLGLQGSSFEIEATGNHENAKREDTSADRQQMLVGGVGHRGGEKKQ